VRRTNYLEVTSDLDDCLANLTFSCSAELSIGDLLGKRCGTTTNYTFTHSELIVTPLQGQSLKYGRHLAIFKIEGRSDRIAVHWSDKPDDFTTLEFSTDKKQLIQMEQQEGDKGARRVFHRC